MLRLTHWAKAQPVPARLLLVLLHVLLVMVAIRLGLGLDLAGIEVPANGPAIAAVVCVIGFFIYPFGKRISRFNWRRRKVAEGIILTGGVAAIALWSASIVATPSAGVGPSVFAVPPAQFTSLTHPDATVGPATAKQQRKDRRLWRRALRTQAKHYLRAQQRKIDKWGAGVLITLTILLAAFLELLVLALACSISCNGAEGLAAVVGILGSVGVVLLAVLAVGAILRALRRSENPDQAEYRRPPRKKILE